MASLKHLASGKVHLLTANHLVGRAPQCHLALDRNLVSNRHAELLWNGSAWELHDLGSLNGCFVDGRQLEKAGRATLKRGAQIGFGDSQDLFEFVDDTPPSALALSDDGRTQISEDGLLILPDPDNPAFTIFDEGGGQWIAESSDGEQRSLNSGDTLAIEGVVWHLELPTIAEYTVGPDSDELYLHRAQLTLNVSRDEEHVELHLSQGRLKRSLQPRAHSYLLLTLARIRLDDQGKPDVTEAEEGWMYVSELLDMLGTNENQLNVSICRARKQLARAGVRHATELFERRPTTRQIRLGIRHIDITTL